MEHSLLQQKLQTLAAFPDIRPEIAWKLGELLHQSSVRNCCASSRCNLPGSINRRNFQKIGAIGATLSG